MTNNKNIINIYTVTPLKEIPPLFFLKKILNIKKYGDKNLWNMFQGISGEASFDFLRVVADPSMADFFLIPHKYSSLKKIPKDNARVLISHFVTLAEKYKKKILVFSMNDSDKHINIPHSIVFRCSQYRYKKRENEIIIPGYPFYGRSINLVDYRKRIWKNITLREKIAKPTVSFCGWAGFSSVYKQFIDKTLVLYADIKTHIFRNKYAGLHKSGIYFRMKAIKILQESTILNTNFIMRRSFMAQSGFDGKNRINPEIAEKENIESIINSDFVLCPKGHGNFSIRFYETLSFGRFPVLINTDCVLPLEDYIDYDKFVVSVDHTRIQDTERAIIDFYNSLKNEEFQERQKMARDAFLLLRPGSFLKIVLMELKQLN